LSFKRVVAPWQLTGRHCDNHDRGHKLQAEDDEPLQHLQQHETNQHMSIMVGMLLTCYGIRAVQDLGSRPWIYAQDVMLQQRCSCACHLPQGQMSCASNGWWPACP